LLRNTNPWPPVFVRVPLMSKVRLAPEDVAVMPLVVEFELQFVKVGLASRAKTPPVTVSTITLAPDPGTPEGLQLPAVFQREVVPFHVDCPKDRLEAAMSRAAGSKVRSL